MYVVGRYVDWLFDYPAGEGKLGRVSRIKGVIRRTTKW